MAEKQRLWSAVIEVNIEHISIKQFSTTTSKIEREISNKLFLCFVFLCVWLHFELNRRTFMFHRLCTMILSVLTQYLLTSEFHSTFPSPFLQFAFIINEDNANTRRGLETAHVKFGHREAVFSGDYIIGRSG